MAAPCRANPAVKLAGLGLAFVLFAAACSNSSDPAPRASSDPAAAAAAALETSTTSTSVTTTTVEPTTTTQQALPVDLTPNPGEVINQYSLTIGDCFDQTRELQNGLPVVTTTKLGCNSPHTFEVYHRLEFPAGFPAVYPGNKVMRDFALESCYRTFDAWVGEKYELSSLDIEVLTPTQQNFEDPVARYRGIHCFVRRSDGDPLTSTTRRSGL